MEFTSIEDRDLCITAYLGVPTFTALNIGEESIDEQVNVGPATQADGDAADIISYISWNFLAEAEYDDEDDSPDDIYHYHSALRPPDLETCMCSICSSSTFK